MPVVRARSTRPPSRCGRRGCRAPAPRRPRTGCGERRARGPARTRASNRTSRMTGAFPSSIRARSSDALNLVIWSSGHLVNGPQHRSINDPIDQMTQFRISIQPAARRGAASAWPRAWRQSRTRGRSRGLRRASSQAVAPAGTVPPRSAAAGAMAISAQIAPMASPHTRSSALSADHDGERAARCCSRPRRAAPARAGARARCAAARPPAPRCRGAGRGPPSVWKVERYVFSTLWNSASRWAAGVASAPKSPSRSSRAADTSAARPPARATRKN